VKREIIGENFEKKVMWREIIGENFEKNEM
jgi:hypothetical protein